MARTHAAVGLVAALEDSAVGFLHNESTPHDDMRGAVGGDARATGADGALAAVTQKREQRRRLMTHAILHLPTRCVCAHAPRVS